MNALVGQADLALIVLDALRYDVAKQEFEAGRTPNLAGYIPGGWEKRHSPGSFTYSAHQAFFAGFLPTPTDPEAPPDRLFAAEFAGSVTSGPGTCTFRAPDIVTGLAERGYHGICIGGVGFFNRRTALSRVLPDLFAEAHWSVELGVTDPCSTEKQCRLAVRRLGQLPDTQRVFLYLNVSAIHQPNCHYVSGKTKDDLESHAAALRYVDAELPVLFRALQKRNDTFVMIGSDHGTLYGEDGFTGHRVGHEHVYTVPWAEFLLLNSRRASRFLHWERR